MLIPLESLEPATVRSLIEEFVTRSGAVHGHDEPSLPDMAEAVYSQLKAGKAVILFDEKSESCTIVVKETPFRPHLE
jgi:uncharacterized protein YheU (UPF0270 family)